MLNPRTLQALAESLPLAFDQEHCRTLPVLPPAAEAAAAWALAVALRRPALLITDGPQTLEERHQDLVALAPGEGDAPCGHLLY